ncbi:MAG: 3-oxoacyl-(acyl-carrier-protein) reductase [Dehalococcoidia bacterium]|nr:3-oxoacyl-(acyl-carrier-protein) reductase [Dehalococcoidia bacterium]
MILEGKIALITGSSRGIGRAIALGFAREGANIVVNYLQEKEKAEAVVKEVEALGMKASAIQGDVSDYNQAEMLIEGALKKFGRIDILVNNAGINLDSTLAKMTPELWHKVIDVTLTSVFNCSHAVVGHMLERGSGKILNVSSVVGQVGVFGTSNYAAAKSGIFGFTKALAKELARKGINVNTLALGYFETGMLVRLPSQIQQNILQQIPMGRFGKEEEVAKTAAFLASEGANYITGQIIHVNGGFYM